MRGLLAGSLALCAGLWVANARGGDSLKLPAVSTNSPLAQKADPANSNFPSVGLGRPVAIDAAPAARNQPAVQDRQVQPAAFSFLTLGRAEPLVRAQIAEAPQPLPNGPLIDTASSPTAKPTNPPPAKIETLSPPRLMPEAKGSKGAAAVEDACDTVDAGPCCDEGCVGGWCGWCKRLCLLPLWRPGECLEEPSNAAWFSGEYLLWAIKKYNSPSLVTTSPPGTARSAAGVLNTFGVSVLSGDRTVPSEDLSGARLALGVWFDREHCCGLEGSYFFIGQRSNEFITGSPGLPILARPFRDAVSNQEASELVAFPGVLAGMVSVRSNTEFHGADFNLRNNLWRGCCWKLDVLYGFRYLELNESLNITESLMVPAGAGMGAGSNILVWDGFTTHNSFYGGQIGLDLELRQRRWSLNLLGKVALGNTHETVNINGSTTFAVPMMPVSVQMGGLLTQPTNIGHYSRDRFAVAPEVGVKLGYSITDWMKLTVGYNFVYISDVVRPGNQIDRVVNTTQLPSVLGPGMLVGPARPTFVMKGTDFWAQGLSLGLEFRY